MAAALPPPPSRTHEKQTAPLSPAMAEPLLQSFLDRTAKEAYLHPDSMLSTSGIEFPPASGPRGGLALHHLHRIAQGIGGKNLVPESREDLLRFTKDAKEEKTLDSDVDRESGGEGSAREQGKKRKRAQVAEWAETSSQLGGSEVEVESLAGGNAAGWQEQEEYEQQQEILQGEVGERGGARVLQQGGKPPDVVEHDEDGRDKAAKNAARKEEKAKRKLEKRQEKAKARG